MPSMKKLAVVNLKGGVGKTTLSTHCAVAMVRLALVTLIFDLDDQGSSAVWSSDRKAMRQQAEKQAEADTRFRVPKWLQFPSVSDPAVLALDAEHMKPEIRKAERSETDVLIFDTVAKSARVAELALKEADYAIIPMIPSGIDMRALPATLEIVRQSRVPYSIVFNNVPPSGTEVEDYTAALEAKGHIVSPYSVGTRKSFKTHMHVGATSLDHDPDGKGAAEIRALTLWICEQAGILVGNLSLQVDRKTSRHSERT